MSLTVILSLIALFLAQAPGWALTLEEAVNDALHNNPQIRQTMALEEAAVAREEKALAPFWPTFKAGYTYWRAEREPGLASRELSSAEASASYNLFNGGSDRFRLAAARERTANATHLHNSQVADVVLATKLAYIETLRAERTLDSAQQQMELLLSQQHEAQQRLAQGLIARNDLLRVDVETASARQELVRAEGQLEIARQSLANTLGRPLKTTEVLAALPLPEEPAPSAEGLMATMLTRRSELQALHSQLAAQKAGEQAVRGDFSPELDLVVKHSWFGNHGLPETGDADYNSDTRAMLQASWTLFSGFDTRSELVGLAHEISALKAAIQAVENQMRLQLHTAVEELHIARTNLATAAVAVEQAKENYRVNENRFKAQVATTVDLLDAQEFLTRARNEQIKARYDLHRAIAVLERVLERGPTTPPRSRP